MIPFAHRAISASAGTGKTWALTHRYLALLAAGESPDRICALTFSRKAAGEIFDSIVERLCLSALNPNERKLTAANIALQSEGLTAPENPRDYTKMLRRLLDQSHRLRVGTLDSFILGIARTFPLELGLPPDVQPMDNNGGEARALRQELLARLFDPRQTEADGENDGTALLQAFRQANFGRESKNLSQQLTDNIENAYDFFRHNSRKSWGVAARIWPTGCWWENTTPKEIAAAGRAEYQEALQQALVNQGAAASVGATCAFIAKTAAEHGPERPWPANLGGVILPQLFEALKTDDPAPEFKYNRHVYSIPAGLWPPLRAALSNLIAVEVQRCLETTTGLYALLKKYDAVYSTAQHREGKLSFDDFARHLGRDPNRPSLDREAADRLYIDYRLDGQFNHWLLDEFQDTSDTQWQAIANLVDEVVQDPEQRRSFFYVGDVKQSIYGWRGGNYRLFEHVRARCGIQPGDTLAVCRRSVPVIIDTVNAVFDILAQWTPLAGAAQGPHPEAVKAFTAAWQKHQSARDQGGYAALLEYEPHDKTASKPGTDSGEEAPGDPAQYEALARIIQQTQPTARGLSAAVLVRNNQQGRECTDVLRRRLDHTPVIHEGTGGIVDNPVVTLLLAMVRYAVHPGNTLAMRHLQMSPWAATRKTEAVDRWLKNLPGRFLTRVYARGFAGALRPWGHRLLSASNCQADSPFGQQRLNEFLAAAEAFDATGNRNGDAFEDFIRSHQVKSEAAAGTIRVMTIHQCKGLGFDMVLVPFDPHALSFGNSRGIDLLRSDAGQALPDDDGWVLKPPGRAVMQTAGGPPTAAFEAARAHNNFGQLCVLYVALTRAKQALYMLVPPAGKKPSAVREADLLRERLAGGDTTQRQYNLPLLYAAGNPEWFQKIEPSPAGPDKPAADTRPEYLKIHFLPPTRRLEPSKDRADNQPFAAQYLFDRQAGDVRHFGSAIHRLFEKIEWIEDIDLEKIIAEWRTEAMEPEELLLNVETQFRNCVANDEMRALLTRPGNSAHTEAWRETPFDYVRADANGPAIVTGRFDRLVIERNSQNQPIRATVVDFKSNRVPDAEAMEQTAEGYRRQMQDYAAAAARLLNLPADKINTILLFTRLAKVYQVL